MDETPPQAAARRDQAAEPSQWASAPPRPANKPGTDWDRVARSWMIVLSLVVLSLSLLTALIAANQAITIWLQPQYAPFVRTGGALLVAALALFVVLRLTQRRGG